MRCTPFGVAAIPAYHSLSTRSLSLVSLCEHAEARVFVYDSCHASCMPLAHPTNTNPSTRAPTQPHPDYMYLPSSSGKRPHLRHAPLPTLSPTVCYGIHICRDLERHACQPREEVRDERRRRTIEVRWHDEGPRLHGELGSPLARSAQSRTDGAHYSTRLYVCTFRSPTVQRPITHSCLPHNPRPKGDSKGVFHLTL